MNIYNKIKWVLGIALVIGLITVTNTLDKQTFSIIKDSVTTIYEDRLIAKNIVLELTRFVHQKEIAAVTANATFLEEKNSAVNAKIDQLIADFSKTKLTEKEKVVFKNLEGNVARLQEMERKTAQPNQTEGNNLRPQLNQIKKNLQDLSEIQLAEGRQQQIISRDAVNKIESFTKMENGMLIFLAFLMILGVVYQPKKNTE